MTLRQPSSSTTATTRKVTFAAEAPRIEKGMARSEMTVAEVQQCWFSKTELAEIRCRVGAIVRVMQLANADKKNKNKNNKSVMYCTRGLEYMQSAKTLQQRQDTKRTLFGAIRRVQRRQWQQRKHETDDNNNDSDNNNNNEEELARISRLVSKSGVSIAIQMGSYDAEIAQKAQRATPLTTTTTTTLKKTTLSLYGPPQQALEENDNNDNDNDKKKKDKDNNKLLAPCEAVILPRSNAPLRNVTPAAA